MSDRGKGLGRLMYEVLPQTIAIAHATRRRRSEARTAASLRALEERLNHELMDNEERQEVRDRVIRLRRRLEAVPQVGRPTADTGEA